MQDSELNDDDMVDLDNTASLGCVIALIGFAVVCVVVTLLVKWSVAWILS